MVQRPDWYLEFLDFAKKTQKDLGEDSKDFIELRKKYRQFFADKLAAGEVSLADHGPNLDEQRQPIDTIVIHHASGKPGYKLLYMEATHLLNIYAPYFINPTIREERGLKGTAIWSGHFRNGKQTFLSYHWLMRMDGSFERLLEDKALAWNSGNWDINKRSVAICLDNDYEKQDPTNEILQKLADHIKQNYPKIRKTNIIGHCEARQGTICPGVNWRSEWKPRLLKHLEEAGPK